MCGERLCHVAGTRQKRALRGPQTGRGSIKKGGLIGLRVSQDAAMTSSVGSGVREIVVGSTIVSGDAKTVPRVVFFAI